jgi:hypothetical protein
MDNVFLCQIEQTTLKMVCIELLFNVRKNLEFFLPLCKT